MAGYKTKKALAEIGHDIWEATQTNIGEDIDVFSSQKKASDKKVEVVQILDMFCLCTKSGPNIISLFHLSNVYFLLEHTPPTQQI